MDKIALSPGEPPADLRHGGGVVEGVADRGAELIWHRAAHQESGALPDLGQDVDAAAGLPVAVRGVLDVHGHIVQQAGLHHGPQHLGAGAVGVQLDGKAQRPDLSGHVQQTRLERRLSAGEAYAVQLASAGLQKVQHRFGGEGGLSLGQDQGPVVAEGAAQLTAGEKHRGCQMAGIVQQRQFG